MTCPHCTAVEARATAAGQRNMRVAGALAEQERKAGVLREALESVAVECTSLPRTVTGLRMRIARIEKTTAAALGEGA